MTRAHHAKPARAHAPTPAAPPGPPAWQTDALKFSRHNADMRPFEAGGEAALEMHCARNNCSLFALGSHQKKRPHNLVLGRLFDFRLYDMVEFGVAAYRSVQSFGGGAAQAQLGNKVGGRPRAMTAGWLGCVALHGCAAVGHALNAHLRWLVQAGDWAGPRPTSCVHFLASCTLTLRRLSRFQPVPSGSMAS